MTLKSSAQWICLCIFLACAACASDSGGSGDGQSAADADVGSDASTGGDAADRADGDDASEDDASGDDDGGSCVDEDGDGFGQGCAAGADCDDTVASCTSDCEDIGGNGVPDCTEDVGEGVFLYWGSNGGGPDHQPADPRGVYEAAGIPAADGETLPDGLAEDYGTLVLLNPREELPGSMTDVASDLVRRGGRVVSVVDHSGFGGHDVAASLLSGIGSTMRSKPTQESGSLDLVLADVPELTDGVTEIKPYYSASVDVGDGVALGQTEEGYIAIGYEELERGDVVIVGDASMFGYALDDGDNTTFIENFANLREE